MGTILFVILFLILIVFFLGIRIVSGLFGFVFKPKSFQKKQHRGTGFNGEESFSGHSKTANKPHNKVFEKNEGEYVDFEEIKKD